jgi:hypothetical protein
MLLIFKWPINADSYSLVSDVEPAPLVLMHVLHGPHGRLAVLAAVAGLRSVRVVQDNERHRL